MTYSQTLDYLYNSLPMYHRIGQAAYKADIVSTQKLMEALGHPECKFHSIHVAGTNGKGSVSHFLASILHEAGYRVGLYTSPHLVDMRERIRINGHMIEQQSVVDFVEANKSTFAELQLSFFEMMVGMAFNHFANNNVDVAVIEVGMGGRLDSTNVITPELSVITNIGFDHTQFLGNTLAKIAAEKAGIIKDGVPVVVGESHCETRPVFEAKAAEHHAPIVFADDHYRVKFGLGSDCGRTVVNVDRDGERLFSGIETPLTGSYQLKNLATLFASIEAIQHQGRYIITPEAIHKGIANVVTKTGLHGRWEIVAYQPLTICETAHNADGVKAMLEKLRTLTYRNLHIVYGCVNDKDFASVLRLMPTSATYYYTQPSVPRRLEAVQLAASATELGMPGKAYTDVFSAVEAAKNNANDDDMILITGSIFLVADAMADIARLKSILSKR
ncbi:MAG: bifunctional folylpolyglutamate synthase/dihydrofolate synthase [Bacteroidales bacterium]|nr:bifunctional folylpolyglutamate synthase/dihydrofolate synthase [Bacteroidales bacterium]